MRLRFWFVTLLIGALSVAVVVAVSPSGGSAAGRSEAAQAASSSTEQCLQARKLRGTSMALVTPHLAKQRLAGPYTAALTDLVRTACGSSGSCLDLDGALADLRTVRGNLLPNGDESDLATAEDALRRLFCAS
jgi:hypothetical protein